jgi:hypothetical protein
MAGIDVGIFLTHTADGRVLATARWGISSSAPGRPDYELLNPSSRGGRPDLTLRGRRAEAFGDGGPRGPSPPKRDARQQSHQKLAPADPQA